MSAKTMSAATPKSANDEIVITRVFNAPRALVYRAWTDPKHLARWWGPRGFTNPRCEADARPGGLIHIDMQAPNGTVYPMSGIYLELIEPEQITLTTGALDEKGALRRGGCRVKGEGAPSESITTSPTASPSSPGPTR